MNRLFHLIKIFLYSVLPNRTSVRESLKTIFVILIGGILLSPLVQKLPMLGWDWYYYFNLHNPAFNLLSPGSYYVPYTHPVLSAITWLNWRSSLGLLNSLTLITVAVSTWQTGGKYGSILLALTSPSLWMLLWLGHPEGIVLLGVMTGLIPLTLIKPMVAFWSNLRSIKYFFWTVIVILLVLFIWPDWVLTIFFGNAIGGEWTHPANFGWSVTGFPVAVIGAILLAGAGNNPWLLMSAGCLLSPYLMPYHLVVLLPAIGKITGWKKIFVWFLGWLLVMGVGLGGTARYLNLLLPLGIYGSINSIQMYRENIRKNIGFIKSIPGTKLSNYFDPLKK